MFTAECDLKDEKFVECYTKNTCQLCNETVGCGKFNLTKDGVSISACQEQNLNQIVNLVHIFVCSKIGYLIQDSVYFQELKKLITKQWKNGKNKMLTKNKE